VTKLITLNNQTIFVPNGILSNGVITNFSVGKNRRANLLFNISYETNIKTAKEIVMHVLENHTKVLKTPAPSVAVNLLTDAHIQLAIRPWSKNADFADMCSDVLEECKEAFDKAGIGFHTVGK
jgi:small conductance mechanosensitive channel